MSAKASSTAGELALYATCGDLVVAFAAREVAHVHASDDVARAASAGELTVVTVAGERYAGWDLATLLGLRRASSRATWLILGHAQGRRFAVACDRSLIVASGQLALRLPPALFASRPGAVVGAFRTAELGLPELAPTGVLLSAAHLLTAQDAALAAAAAARGELQW